MDNTSYHWFSVIKEYLQTLSKNIKVEFLPPYIPKLNPTETCWRIIKSNVTNSTHFPTMDNIQEKIEKFANTHNFMLNVGNYLCN